MTLTSFIVALLLIVLNLLWLTLNLFGLPGNWLIVLTTAVTVWMQWGSTGSMQPAPMFSLRTLLAITVLAALGEVMELAAAAAGARQAGGTRRGSIGALMGGVAGAIAGTFLIPIPIVGSLMGACAALSLSPSSWSCPGVERSATPSAPAGAPGGAASSGRPSNSSWAR